MDTLDKKNYRMEDNNQKHFIKKVEGTAMFPTLNLLYSFFVPRSRTITCWCIGFDQGGVETHFLETLGCQIDIFDPRPEATQRFADVKRILTNHKAEASDPTWMQSYALSWSNPEKLVYHNNYPFHSSGILDLSGAPAARVEAISLEKVPRLDLLKVDADDFTTTALYTLMSIGYRPGLLYVHWHKHPDKYNDTMLCAGHLQNIGYRLLSSNDNWFLYRFDDDCMYEYCSWERTDCANPLFDSYKKMVLSDLLANNPNKK